MYDDELKHYGVLGMKWGVRHNPVKAYERSSAKLKRLEKRSDKAKIRYSRKARRHLTESGVRAENKARQKSARAEAKAISWKRAMDREFSERKLSKASDRYAKKGQKYVEKSLHAKNSGRDKLSSRFSDKAKRNYRLSEDANYLNTKINGKKKRR